MAPTPRTDRRFNSSITLSQRIFYFIRRTLSRRSISRAHVTLSYHPLAVLCGVSGFIRSDRLDLFLCRRRYSVCF